MKPYVICLMITSLDGGLHPSRFTASPDGDKALWGVTFENIHNNYGADGWVVGRVTMAEMSKAGPHPPVTVGKVERPVHVADRGAKSFAVAVDPSGKVHFSKPDVGGDHVIVLLGATVPDSHLAELAGDGVSYIVSDQPQLDLAAMLDVLNSKFGIKTLMLEGGAAVNGSFFAAGLVDELSLLVAPAVHAQVGHEGFIAFGREGLAGKVRLSLKSCETLEHGIIHLCYTVTPA